MLLIAGAGILTLMVLFIVGFDFNELLRARGRRVAGRRGDPRARACKYTNPIDFLSLGLALVLGTAGLPHVLMRFYTVPSAKEARRSVVWAIWLIGIFYLFTLVLGFGAGALVGPEMIASRPAARTPRHRCSRSRSAAPVLMAVISAIAFATILAVVAGLAITAATSFAHDIYASIIKRGDGSRGRR